MPFTETNGLRYFTFSSFDRAGIKHGIFSRRGGVSHAPWNSLNTGGLSGDERANVIENRRRIFESVALPVESIFDVWQVHSSTVVVAERPRPTDFPHQKADAIITNKKGLTLFMRFGDCVPILLLDTVKRVIGIAHAGWQGTVKSIGEKTVKAMQLQFGSDPKDIVAGIGPSIGPDHYQIGLDVAKKILDEYGHDDHLIDSRGEKLYLNLWETNRASLRRAGVSQIEISGICTACNTDDWFSHRAEHGRTGRFSALISLSE